VTRRSAPLACPDRHTGLLYAVYEWKAIMTHAPERKTRFAVNCSILFTELPLLERPAAAKDAGFDAVELWWPFESAVPADAEVEQFERAIRDAGVQLIGLNFAAGDMPGGDRGLVSWPQRSKEFRDNIAVTLGIGAGFGGDAEGGLRWTEEILRRQAALGVHDVGDVLEQRGRHLDAVGRCDDAVRTLSASAARQPTQQRASIARFTAILR